MAPTGFWTAARRSPPPCAEPADDGADDAAVGVVEEIRRVMGEANIDSAEIDKKIRRTDSQLRAYLPIYTDFAWDAQLQPLYPQDKFWWLYKKPSDRR